MSLLWASAAPAQSTSLEPVRKQMQAGQYERAWLALQEITPTPESLRLEVEASVHLGKVARAIETYARLVSMAGQPDAPALAAIARAVLDGEQQAPDPLTRAESCRALLRAGVASCATFLEAGAKDATWPPLAKLVAAAAVAENDPSRARLLSDVASTFRGRDLAQVAIIIPDLPAPVAVPILTAFVTSSLPDIQYQGAMLLANFDTPAVRQSLKALASGGGMARSAARFSLAQLGDPDELRAVADALPRLQRSELYRAGRALAAAGDERGLHALEDVMAGDDPALRLDAAAALARWSRERAQPVLEGALTDPAPHIRAQALALVARLGWPPFGSMWKLLTDENAVVRVRAAGICVRGVNAKSPRANAR